MYAEAIRLVHKQCYSPSIELRKFSERKKVCKGQSRTHATRSALLCRPLCFVSVVVVQYMQSQDPYLGIPSLYSLSLISWLLSKDLHFLVNNYRAPPLVQFHYYSPQFRHSLNYLSSYYFVLQSPCCSKVYSCRLCHDEQESHRIDRHAITEIICRKCSIRQPVSRDNW